MKSTEEIVVGVIENVVYKNEANDYSVLEIVDSDSSLITAVGTIPMPSEGESVTLRGNWTFHKEFGKQFAFTSFEKALPVGVDGILQYLSSRTVKGIGPVTAQRIVNRFAENTFDVIENHPEWLTDVPGITMKKAAAISESFREQSGIRGIMLFCRDFIGSAEVTRVYKALGQDAVGIIKENPYVLCDSDFGISFEKADALAKSLSVKSDSEFRVISGLTCLLNYNANINGHTCLPKDKLVAAAVELLSLDRAKLDELVDSFIQDGSLVAYDIGEVRFIMTKEVNETEENILKKLSVLNKSITVLPDTDIAFLINKAESSFGISYAELQKRAITEAFYSGVMIITGGPGTGKTTIVKALISIFGSLGKKCALTAPTGRAAKRMSDSTAEEARTIHRMLEMERGKMNRLRFGKNAINTIDEDVIIVDEASMMDLSLFEALLLALKRGARLILIGDADQLPSVGAGNVFSDLINSSHIKTVRLNEIFRQSKESLIVTNAHKINLGQAPTLNSVDGDFFFVRREDEKMIPSTIASLITERLPKKYGQTIRDMIQVITPSKKGVGGVETLNAELQQKINPPMKFKNERAAHGTVFREGDRVMQISNNYEIEWKKNGKTGNGVFNGDIGVIETINTAREEMGIRFDDRYAVYTFDMLDELELAYAITVHKSQGSEYPVVIIPMYFCAPMLMTRNLLYTAVTRAKKMVILVGRSDAPSFMVRNNRHILRYTTLGERISSSPSL